MQVIDNIRHKTQSLQLDQSFASPNSSTKFYLMHTINICANNFIFVSYQFYLKNNDIYAMPVREKKSMVYDKKKMFKL